MHLDVKLKWCLSDGGVVRRPYYLDASSLSWRCKTTPSRNVRLAVPRRSLAKRCLGGVGEKPARSGAHRRRVGSVGGRPILFEVRTMTPAQPRRARNARIIDSIQATEKTSLEAVRRFLDTVDEAFPHLSDEKPRRKIIDSAFEMTEHLVASATRFAQDIVNITQRAVSESERKPAKKAPTKAAKTTKKATKKAPAKRASSPIG